MNHSIILFYNNKAIYTSDGTRIKPLFDLVKQFKDSEYKNCTLYDKVVGLAAARLIVYSKIISKVNAHLLSKKAKDFLEQNDIPAEYDFLTERILNQDKTDSCPMEKAAENRWNEEFYQYLEELFNEN